MADAAGGSMTGAQRAAIFLLGVGEEAATSIMRHMQPREVQRIGEAMASLSAISNDQVETVLKSFHEKANSLNSLTLDTKDFTRRVLTQALGDSKARSLRAKIAPGKDDTSGIEALRWMDPSAVADLLEDEHPQIVAIVLASLDEEQSAQVLVCIPEPARSEGLLRLARLQVIDPAAMEELDEVLEKQMGKARKTALRSINGMITAAAILNNIRTDVESQLLATLREADAELGEKVSDLMFVFGDFIELDDRGMQRLIREISVDNLVIALKGVDDLLQEKFFSNMSERAAEMLRENLEVQGPVRLVEVEAKQKEILSIASRLSDDGEITLGKSAEEYV